MKSTRMPQAVEPIEHKTSNLLTSEENQTIVRLLGPRCLALATCVIQLYQTQPPHHSQWIKKETGVLCLVKDNFRKNYFFRLYCFKRNCMVYEQELYNNMDYVVSCPFLHTFEGDDCMIGFNYANEDEARDMKLTVEQKLHAKRKREERRLRINNDSQQSSMVSTNNTFQLNNNNISINKPLTKKDKQKRNLTKADIGKPLEFRHVAHVGWDPDKGFAVESLDDNLKHFFQKAGVSESHLKDKETRQFIYNFIELNGGRERLEQESRTTGSTGGVVGGGGGGSSPGGKPLPPVPPPPQLGAAQGAGVSTPGPPVPPRGAPKPPNRMAPKPPAQSPPTRAPPQTPASRTPSTTSSSSSAATTASAAFAAPPPPPPPLPVAPLFNSESSSLELSTSAVQQHHQHSHSHSASGSVDVRSALMESIRSGAQLKPIEVEEKRQHVETDARDDLLCEIRKGIQLKPANEREVKPISPPTETAGSDLAAALNRALRERNRVIHSEDDSNSEDTDDDDEWEA